jgi:hypothetical protein
MLERPTEDGFAVLEAQRAEVVVLEADGSE